MSLSSKLLGEMKHSKSGGVSGEMVYCLNLFGVVPLEIGFVILKGSNCLGCSLSSVDSLVSENCRCLLKYDFFCSVLLVL